LRLLGRKNIVLSGFEKHHCSGKHEDAPSDEESHPGHDLRLYINDVMDHVTTMVVNLHHFESLLARSQNNYLAGLSIDRMQGSQRVNRFINIMAVVSMILTAMTIVSALFSTNVNAEVPLYANDTPAWYIIVGSQIAVSLALFWLARRLKWC
jgi:Mg2+ and Co2+ transporter CorA